MAKRESPNQDQKMKAAEEARRMAEIIDAKRKIREAEKMQQERVRLGTGDEDAKLLTAAIEAKRRLRELGVDFSDLEAPKAVKKEVHTIGGRQFDVEVIDSSAADNYPTQPATEWGHPVTQPVFAHQNEEPITILPTDEGDMDRFELIIEEEVWDENGGRSTIATSWTTKGMTGPATEHPVSKEAPPSENREDAPRDVKPKIEIVPISVKEDPPSAYDWNDGPDTNGFTGLEKDTLQGRQRIRFDATPWIKEHIDMKDALTEYFSTFVNFNDLPEQKEECPLTFWINHPKPSRTPKLNEYHEVKKRHRRYHEIIDSIMAKEFIGANVDGDIKELARATLSLTLSIKELNEAMGSHTADHHPGEGQEAYVEKNFDPTEFHGKKWSQEHTTWRVCLIAHAKGEKTPRIARIAESDCCALGKWILHAQNNGHQFPQDEFDELVRRHDAYHETVKEVITLMEDNLDPSEKLRDIIRATSSLSSILARLDPEAIV